MIISSKNRFFGILIVFFSAISVHAAVQSRAVVSKDGKVEMEGLFYFDDTWKESRPGILIIPQWMGVSDHEKASAERLVAQGYAAFIVDLYGKDQRPTDIAEATKKAGELKDNMKLFLKREKLALESFAKEKLVDRKRVVIMGYCLGGTGALHAVRGGLPVLGAVSFHGGLSTPQALSKKTNVKMLVLHGAIDRSVPPSDVEGFMNEMEAVNADYQIISYSGAVHSFTSKKAGHDPSKGNAYNEAADRRSWVAFMDFLDEVVPVNK